MLIRRYKSSDHKDVMALHVAAMEGTGAYRGEGPWDDDLSDIEGIYFNDKGEFLVGDLEEKIIAMGAFKRIDERTAEVKRMRVYPEYQGRGFGKAILNELYILAKALNYRTFILETSIIQVSARKLYENFGFLEYKREKIMGFDCIRYRLDF